MTFIAKLCFVLACSTTNTYEICNKNMTDETTIKGSSREDDPAIVATLNGNGYHGMILRKKDIMITINNKSRGTKMGEEKKKKKGIN